MKQIITEALKNNNPQLILDHLGVSREELIESLDKDKQCSSILINNINYPKCNGINCIDNCPFSRVKPIKQTIDFINQNNNIMKAPKLETGMLVQLENGTVLMVINGAMYTNNTDWEDFECYNKELVHSEYCEYSIVKVSKVLKDHLLKPKFWTEATLNANILWERDKETELTVSQVAELLKKHGELTGKLKIVE